MWVRSGPPTQKKSNRGVRITTRMLFTPLKSNYQNDIFTLTIENVFIHIFKSSQVVAKKLSLNPLTFQVASPIHNSESPSHQHY
jgi:hypothetical protein